MSAVSNIPRKMSWREQPRRVSVLAEMALRQEKVSDRLRELRELHGLSQEDAARRVGITNRQWQRWESGESMPYPRSLDMVASSFGITVAEFFDEQLAETPEPGQMDRIEALLIELRDLLSAEQARDVIDTTTEALRRQAPKKRASTPRSARAPRKAS